MRYRFGSQIATRRSLSELIAPYSFATNDSEACWSQMWVRTGASPGGRRPPSPASGRSNGLLPRRRSQGDVLYRGGRKRLFAGLARLVAPRPFDALGHEPRLPSPHHRLDLPDRRRHLMTTMLESRRRSAARHLRRLQTRDGGARSNRPRRSPSPSRSSPLDAGRHLDERPSMRTQVDHGRNQPRRPRPKSPRPAVKSP